MAVSIQSTTTESIWPSLPLVAWQDTYATLHRWTQIVGKIRLALAPNLNHWWQSTFLVVVRQSIQGESQIWPIGSHGKPTRTKSVVVVFGQGVGQL